jgi:thiol-disulfide isomerase/thioredoxin
MIELKDQDLNEFIKQDTNILVMFSASWCETCELFKTLLKKRSKKYPNIIFTYINVDKYAYENTFFPIDVVPTFAGYSNGVLVTTASGGHINNVENVIKTINEQ